MEFPTAFLALPARPPLLAEAPVVESNLQTLVESIILTRFSPAAVLANTQGDILYIKGRTGQYLEPAAGRANWNLFTMAREGLRDELLGLCQRARGESEALIRRGVRVKTNGDYQMVDLTVQALNEPAALRGLLLVVLTEGSTSPVAKRRGKAAAASGDAAFGQDEARQLRETLQSTREEMQTSQEELKSANEELQSTNEELQSTNEELTTSKEEMQSLNEELQTVNAELQAKIEELSRISNDMKNLLNSTDIATLFLDDELHVRRFTSPLTKLIKLIPSDVGRSITDIASDLLYPTLINDVTEVLRTLVFIEKSVATRDHCWFKVRIMPYRTLDNRIDGVVVTFSTSRCLPCWKRNYAGPTRNWKNGWPTRLRNSMRCGHRSPAWAIRLPRFRRKRGLIKDDHAVLERAFHVRQHRFAVIDHPQINFDPAISAAD